ncbi:hypothetical protein [Parabacteroides sp. AF14-59]|uniref:hypothetical protein n=1 Tax=Parabacteroides sp. AF14-59 TaxID=2292240 RepID=UPI000EFFFB16|nr:hypothetical protein [Parabacteroides sp. AF14-59]RHR91515.1 hypothetical protein DWW23_25835 [Parabacteroides sp. AF14-59]
MERKIYLYMKTIIYIIFLFLFLNCNNNNEITYENKLLLTGNISEYFSQIGEIRSLSIKYTSIPVTSDQEAEDLLKNSEITCWSENNKFTFSDYTISGSNLNFKIICKENKTDNIIEDKIHIHIINSRFNHEITENLKQRGADIRYEYKIEADIEGSYTIPAKGGTFNIPIQGKRLSYINNNLTSIVPYSLKGLYFVSNNVNTAWVHSTSLIFGKSPGEYFIELTAQPYNFDGEYLWTAEFRYDDKVLYHLEIFHPQTPGENYLIPYTKTIYENIFINE